jgi:hypothetical protein
MTESFTCFEGITVKLQHQPNDHETAASPRQMKDAVREAAERGRSNF